MLSGHSTTLQNSARLAALRRVALLDTPAEEAFDRLTRLATTVLEVPVALVSLVDGERQFFKSQCGLPEPWASRRETPLSHSFCQHVVSTREPLVISDAREHPLVERNLAIRDLRVIAYAGIPLISSEGFELGSFCAIDSRPREWSERDIAVLRDLAASAMTEIELRTEVVQRMAAEDALRAANDELVTLSVAADTARDRAERAVQERNEVISMATHDLRNPLQTLAITLEILRSVPLSEPDRHRHMATALRAVDRMSRLLDNLLDLRRIEAGQALGVTPHPIDVSDLIEQGCDMVRAQAERKEIRIDHQIPPHCPAVMADPDRILQVFWNLIGNAVKFTPNGGRIGIGCEAEDATVRFRISDSGPGIASEHLQRIFDPFWQHTGDGGGAGLGLTIARSIVEAHGGTIEVQSGAGEGASFFFTLPSARSGQAAAAAR